MSNIGLPEIAIVLVIVLVIFGPKRLPQLGRSLGSGMREFKDAVTGKNKDDEQGDDQHDRDLPDAEIHLPGWYSGHRPAPAGVDPDP